MIRIASLEVFPIRLRLREPIPMASGTIETSRNVIVKMTSEDGVVGWGEGVEAPALTGHSQTDIVRDVESIRDVVVGEDVSEIAEVWELVSRAFPGATTAAGAVDIALHDVVARSLGVPIHGLLGGAVRETVTALTLVGSGEPDADIEKLLERRAAGHTWFKIKLGMGPPDKELKTLRAAVDIAGPGGVVAADVNEGWSEIEATTFLSKLEGSGVRFVEQPVSRVDPALLLRVAKSSPVAICADESAGTLEDVAGFAGGPVRGVSLKLIKHGGITGVMRGAAFCARSGLEVNLAGKVIESSISAAGNLHCAAAMQSIEFGCSPANQGVITDVSHDPVTLERGVFAVPTGPGLGVEVDEDRVRSLVG